MKLIHLSLLLFLPFFIFSETIHNQSDIDHYLANQQKEQLSFEFSYNCPSVSLDNLHSCQNCKDLILRWTANPIQSRNEFIWTTLLTIPSLPNIEKITLSPFGEYVQSFYPSDTRPSSFWDYLYVRFPNLKSINLNYTFLSLPFLIAEAQSEDLISKLAELYPALEELHLAGVKLTDSLFNQQNPYEPIKHFKKLRFLDLSQTKAFYYFDFLKDLTELEILKIGQAEAVVVKSSWVENIEVYGAPTLPQFFKDFQLYNLHTLDLSQTKIDDLDLSFFAPNLRSLNIDRCILNTNVDVISFLKDLESLSLDGVHLSLEQIEQLNYCQLPKLNDLNMANVNAKKVILSSLSPNLNTLHMENSNITAGNLKDISLLTNLVNLYLDHTKISGHSLKYLQNIQGLKSLSLKGINLQNANFESLCYIEELDLSDTLFSLQDFEKLYLLTNLKVLNVRNLKNKNITKEKLENLKNSLNTCHVKF